MFRPLVLALMLAVLAGSAAVSTAPERSPHPGTAPGDPAPPARSAAPDAALSAGPEVDPSRPRAIPLPGLEEPAAVAVSPDGAIYVCETIGERISVFDRSGTRVARWGRSGSGPGELRAPRGIAVGADGRVYVSNTWNHRVDVFRANGAFERSWGAYGSAPGEFIDPLGIAVDAARVYVADSKNDRVQVFDLAGRFLFYVWSRGTRDGQLDRPVDVAAGDGGSFHVSDQGNSRVQTFDREGGFVRSWGGWGPHPGLLAEPGGIEASGGRLYVCDTHNHRVQIFGAEGELLGEWGPSILRVVPEDPSRVFPSDVAMLPDGRGAVVCDAFRDRCTLLEDFAGRFSQPDVGAITSFFRAGGIVGETLFAGAGSGAVLAIDTSRERPSPAGTFGGHGRETSQFVRAASVVAGPEPGTILVSDIGNHRLAAFRLTPIAGPAAAYDSTRTRFLRSLLLSDEEAIALWPGRWPVAPAAIAPGRAAAGGRGEIFVIDDIHSRVVAFGGEGRPIAAWGRHGEADGELLEASDLALDRSRTTVYVADAARARIQAFDTRGRLLDAWGKRGRGRSDLRCPTGIAIDRDGSILVVDRWAGRVQRFSRRGTLQAVWGGPGAGPGQLEKPERIFVDGSGRVIVIDAGGARAQAFTRGGKLLWDCDVDDFARILLTRPPPQAPVPPAAASGTPHGSATLPSRAAGQRKDRSKAAASESTAQGSAGDGSAPAEPASECGSKVESSGGRYVVCYDLSEDPIPLNTPFDIDVRVYDAGAAGQLASMIALGVDALMPEHGHGLAQPPQVRAAGEAIPRELRPDHSNVHGAVGNGRFEVRGMRLHMPGRWEIDFDIGRGAWIERAQVEIVLD